MRGFNYTVNIEEARRSFGKEYPAAVIQNGVRMPLGRETRFMRVYCLPDKKEEHHISRFMDGSASITASELQREWPTWTEYERIEFCQACCWLGGQPDFPVMLRFIMQHGSPDDWSGITSSVAVHLPRAEAFEILLRALRATEIGRCSNFTQAIAITKHPEAETTLRQHLDTLWAHEKLWDTDAFINWVAFDATTCIAHLIELGAPPADFEDQIRRLSQHICPQNRDSCRNFLAKHYAWLTSC
jgi:hypothetical protein